LRASPRWFRLKSQQDDASTGFHSSSDAAAGVIVGSLIGTVVGKSFQSRT